MNSAVRAIAVTPACSEPTQAREAAGLSTTARDLLIGTGVMTNEPVVDIGGHPDFVGEMLRRGFNDLTVVNASAEALRHVAACAYAEQRFVTFLRMDILGFKAARSYAVWHDAGVYQTLITTEARVAYRNALNDAVSSGGQFVVSTFGLEAPAEYNGLPVARYNAQTLAAEFNARFALQRAHTSLETAADGSFVERVHAQFLRRQSTSKFTIGRPSS